MSKYISTLTADLSDIVVGSLGSLPYILREHPRARRLSVRIDPLRQALIITMPRNTSPERLQDFLKKTEAWAQNKFAKLLPPVLLDHGSVIHILEQELTLISVPESQKRLWREGNHLYIGGHPENLPIRAKAWIISTLKTYVEKRSHEYAGQINKKIKEIRVRDLKSRWGSCNSKGSLCYTWRLAFAPLSIIDYVCAHEVGHLAEMNHSPRFWKIVHQLCPQALSHRQWLKKHGSQLLRYA